MRLSLLSPKWLQLDDGHRLGITFICPDCQGCYLTVMAAPTPIFNRPMRGRPSQLDDKYVSQMMLLSTVLPANDLSSVVPANPHFGWTFTPDIQEATFENLTISPSIDMSGAGCWHGHVINGTTIDQVTSWP